MQILNLFVALRNNVIHECLLIHGHYGYSKDLPIEQRLRDSILTEIGDGDWPK